MSLVKMKKEYSAVLSEAQVMTFLQIVHRYPKATLSDVAKFAKACGLGKLGASTLIGELPRTPEEWMQKFSEQKALPAARATKAKASRKPRKQNRKSPKGKRVLTTERHKSVFDAKIHAFLADQDDWVKADIIRGAVGGTSLQVRTGLNRLIDSGKVKYDGFSRGMTYRAK
jgi:hypothetical protein